MAQNRCVRDESHVWVCIPMPKWPIYFTFLNGPFWRLRPPNDLELIKKCRYSI